MRIAGWHIIVEPSFTCSPKQKCNYTYLTFRLGARVKITYLWCTFIWFDSKKLFHDPKKCCSLRLKEITNKQNLISNLNEIFIGTCVGMQTFWSRPRSRKFASESIGPMLRVLLSKSQRILANFGHCAAKTCRTYDRWPAFRHKTSRKPRTEPQD
jgi:hypothetical protein